MWSNKTVFNIDDNTKWSEGSCSSDAENSALNHGNKMTLQKTVLLNCTNISHHFSFYSILDQINAAFVRRLSKTLLTPNFLNGDVHIYILHTFPIIPAECSVSWLIDLIFLIIIKRAHSKNPELNKQALINKVHLSLSQTIRDGACSLVDQTWSVLLPVNYVLLVSLLSGPLSAFVPLQPGLNASDNCPSDNCLSIQTK